MKKKVKIIVKEALMRMGIYSSRFWNLKVDNCVSVI